MLRPDWFLSLELQQWGFGVSPVASLQHPSDSHNLGTVHHCFSTTLDNDSKLTKLSTDYSLSVHHNYWIHCLQISPTSQKQATGAYKSIVSYTFFLYYLIPHNHTHSVSVLRRWWMSHFPFSAAQFSVRSRYLYYAVRCWCAILEVLLSIFLQHNKGKV